VGAAASDYFPATLSQCGHSVTIIGLSGGNSDFLKAAKVKVVEVANDRSWIAALRNQVRTEKPDIVHVFIHTGCGIYPLVLGRWSGRPKFLLDIRSPLLRNGLPSSIARVKNRLEAISYDAIGAHSIESAWTVIGRSKDIECLPLGVDLKSIPDSSPNRSDQIVKRLIYIGSLHPRRKISKMIDAVLLASYSCPLRLDIYGGGIGEKIILDKLAEESLRSVQVHLKGIVPRQELFNCMGDYDLGLSYVPTEIYGPAPPLKALEYLASGLPVVATNTIGNALFVQDLHNGVLVDENPCSFADGISLLAQNDGMRLQMAHNARSSIVKYDWQNIVEGKILPVYVRLLRGSN